MTKTCKKCGVSKAIEFFYAAKRYRDGHQSNCKLCASLRQKAYYQTHKHLWQAAEKLETEAEREKGRATTRAWHRRHLQKIQETGVPCKYVLRRKYNLSLRQYDALLADQNGVCKLCGELEKVAKRSRLSIDHDHKTGKVRGLLCFKCNTALGKINDSTSWLLKAVQYLTPTQNGPR